MRRTLFLLALLAPALAPAQSAPSAGQVTYGTSGTDDGFINLAECTAGDVELFWNVKVEGNEPVTTGKFRLYATSTAPGSTEPRYCAQTDADPVYADQVGGELDSLPNVPTGSARFDTDLIRAAATADTFDCADTTQADRTLTVCVHYFDTSVTPEVRKGWAVGALTLSLRLPPAPASVTAQGGDGALTIRWVAGTATGTQAAPASHRIVVTQQGGGSPITVDATGVERRVDGLVNGTAYDVEVFGLSAAKNPSATSVATSGTPVLVDDFWDYYGGVEQGGCSAGAAGPVALLGLAGLLALLRRRK